MLIAILEFQIVSSTSAGIHDGASFSTGCHFAHSGSRRAPLGHPGAVRLLQQRCHLHCHSRPTLESQSTQNLVSAPTPFSTWIPLRQSLYGHTHVCQYDLCSVQCSLYGMTFSTMLVHICLMFLFQESAQKVCSCCRCCAFAHHPPRLLATTCDWTAFKLIPPFYPTDTDVFACPYLVPFPHCVLVYCIYFPHSCHRLFQPFLLTILVNLWWFIFRLEKSVNRVTFYGVKWMERLDEQTLGKPICISQNIRYTCTLVFDMKELTTSIPSCSAL